MSLEELFKGRGIDLPSSMGHLKKVATELGLPWGMRTRTYNSRRAQEFGKWAEALGKGDEFHKAVFQAYFTDGRNIADISVLKEIAGKVGLDGRMAEQALAERTFKEAVDRDWEYSRTCGITAVPTFMVDGRIVVGAQPYQALEDLVSAAGGICGNDGRSPVWPIGFSGKDNVFQKWTPQIILLINALEI